MARPFRYWPPEPQQDTVLRPRIQSVLAGRFDRRVTVIRAGAGFGKTTSISQAFAENSLAPLGVDCWLACEPDDLDVTAFAQAVANMLGLSVSVDLDELVRAASEVIGARSPSQVCISFDDVQFLCGGASVSVLDRLISDLPSNAHLLLSGRIIPDVALTRLELIGDCVVLDEAALAFDPAEAAAVLGDAAGDDAAGDAASGAFGGWPALVQLAGSGRARTFVREEVLRGLTDEELSVLRCLAVLGECDVSVLERVAGHACERIVEVLPLLHRRGNRCAAHDLWSELLAPIDRTFVEATRRRAAEVLLADGSSEEALSVLAPLATFGLDRRDELVGRCLRSSLISSTRVRPERLRAWSATWSDSDGWTDDDVCPEHLLVAALVARLDNPGSERSHSLLRRAAARFAEVGDAEASAESLGALVYACHVRRDVPGLLWAFGELATLAESGVASAQPYPMLTSALVATSSSSPQDVIGLTTQLLERRLGEELRAIVLWLHANSLANLGENSVAAATACHEIGLPLPGMAAIYSGARWRAGLIRESLSDPTRVVDGTRDRFLQATWSCCLHAALGDVERARSALAVVEQAAGDASQWQTTGSIRLPQAILAYAERRDDDAARHVREFLAETPREGQGEFYRLFSIGLLVPLAPDERDWLLERSRRPGFGPLYRRDLDLALAAHALDLDADVAPAANLDYPATAGEMMPSVGLRNGAPLLAAAVGAGRVDLGPLLEDWIDMLGERARSAWRALFDHPVAEVAAGARTLVEAMPIRPEAPVRLTVFGPTELSIGGVVVDHADWRRERVRALLTHLVLVGETTRERVIAALWPDADDAAGRRNLRSTLNVLHSVLEPGRHGGDATFFVRTNGQRIRLVVAEAGLDNGLDSGLDVDVVRFEQLLDQAVASERSGTPSLSIAPYLDAVRLYRGDLLPECYDDWAVFQRDRLRSRYVAGGVRVAELLVATGRATDAIDTISEVLAVEPWSEPAHRALIAAHLSLGDLAAARRSLQTCEHRLADIGGPSDEATFELVRRIARR